MLYSKTQAMERGKSNKYQNSYYKRWNDDRLFWARKATGSSWAYFSFATYSSQLSSGAMVSPAAIRDVGIEFMGLKRSLCPPARSREGEEKQPELEGTQPQRSPAAAWESEPRPARAHAL